MPLEGEGWRENTAFKGGDVRVLSLKKITKY
jgi:hypothetical protein